MSHVPPSGEPLPPKAPRCDAIVADVVSVADDDGQHRFLTDDDMRTPRRRRVILPLFLFLLTCISTFWAGTMGFTPMIQLQLTGNSELGLQTQILQHWQDGLIYMLCVLAILLTHEMGHFIATVCYRIAASFPYFLPIPITPIGTMGAVIGMDGLSANRKEMFDIGIAGPLAGLVVALPITWYGMTQLDLRNFDPQHVARGAEPGHIYDMPLLMRKMLPLAKPKGYDPNKQYTELPTGRINPFFMAGWVGLLITGLNMLPISQLDGGHVIYALFGKAAHVIARTFLIVAMLFVAFNLDKGFIWVPMLILVTFIGTDHPPTADDNVPLGTFRTLLGFASLAIPLYCFPPLGLRVLGQ